MSHFLFENPLYVLLLGATLTLVAATCLLKSGRWPFAYVALGLMVLTAIAVTVNIYVVTPKEEIRSTLLDIAADLETNDTERILRHVAASADSVRSSAANALRRVQIDRVAIKNNLVVKWDRTTHPQSAKARFNAVIVGSEKKGGIRDQTAPFLFIVDFVKEADVWKVASYQRRAPIPSMNTDNRF